jgi:PI-3-kinase-related kinase SMG-1
MTPANGWAQFKRLHQLLHQRSSRRHLALDEISPKLAQLRATSIPMPGKDGQFSTIHSITNSVLVLPTKTKPKKLLFTASDGRRFPFLFKGLEDLHLDERVMQLLAIVNTMFAKANREQSPAYHALNYSVTPLGPRSGLISWVEDSTPLFALYKKWQQREAQAGKQPAAVARPNDLFYAKLNPLLRDKGLAGLQGPRAFTGQRAQCPAGVLRQVLEELVRETPGDLLARELWCGAGSAGGWWASVQRYSRSTAVMSMVGYVLGLGDRHLDNLLVNVSSGLVAHIDYNVCFEKGRGLRVPERVPFRLTQNLQRALGATGVEGLFRRSCEHALATLRSGRETLLTLLEAFVYDPLLDWTGHDAGIIASFYGGGAKPESEAPREGRRAAEKRATQRLLEIRLAENRSLAAKNQERLMRWLARLGPRIAGLCETAADKGDKEQLIRLYEMAKIYLDESLTLHGDGAKNKGKATTILVLSS